MEKPLTQTQFIEVMAKRTGLLKKDMNEIFISMHDLVVQQLSTAGEVRLPHLSVKLVLKEKAATPVRIVKAPSGSEVRVAAKPAQKVVRARVLKPLQDTFRPILKIED
jgi:nucleoid DNA-binding protein